MAGDVGRLRVAKCHHPGNDTFFVDCRSLAGQESGDFYPGEQHRTDACSTEILDHYPPAIGRCRRCSPTYCRVDERAVDPGIRAPEGIRLLSANRLAAVGYRHHVLHIAIVQAPDGEMVRKVIS